MRIGQTASGQPWLESFMSWLRMPKSELDAPPPMALDCLSPSALLSFLGMLVFLGFRGLAKGSGYSLQRLAQRQIGNALLICFRQGGKFHVAGRRPLGERQVLRDPLQPCPVPDFFLCLQQCLATLNGAF